MSVLQIPSQVDFSAENVYRLVHASSLPELTKLMQSLLLHLPNTTGSHDSSSSSPSTTSSTFPEHIPRNIIVFTELYISTLTAAKALHLHSGKIATVLNMIQNLIQQCQQNQWPEDYTVIAKLWETMMMEHTNTSLPYRAGPNGGSSSASSSSAHGSTIGSSSSAASVTSTVPQPINNPIQDTGSIVSQQELSVNSLGSVTIMEENEQQQHDESSHHSHPHHQPQNSISTIVNNNNNNKPSQSSTASSVTDENNVPIIPGIEKLRSGEAQAITEYCTTFGFLRHYHYYKYICTVPLPIQSIRMIVPIDTPLMTAPLEEAVLEKEIHGTDGHDIPLHP